MTRLKLEEIKVGGKAEREKIEQVFKLGQEHIFRWWPELSPDERDHLLAQLSQIDFFLLERLVNKHLKGNLKFKGTMKVPDFIPLPRSDFEKDQARQAKALGETALSQGKVAILTVAGGQGTRLGYEKPKGMFPIGPLSGKSLFQLQGEKILALGSRYEVDLPWYIMTSPKNDEETRQFFEKNGFFSLRRENVHFFKQGMLPALDREGKLILEAKDSITMSPNGHGGTISALKEEGMLEEMKKRGIEEIFYFQVDNPLVRIADPIFLGYHLQEKAEMSLKVIKKRYPEEKLGVVGYINRKLRVVEYSDLSDELMRERNPDGSLKYSLGSIAIHLFKIDFLEREIELPFHRVEKKIPYLEENGILIQPKQENGIKFEMFIFDALKNAQNSVVMEVAPEDEFAPLKQAQGKESPTIIRQAMSNLFGRWLRQAGVKIPLDEQGNVKGIIEISPLFALDAEELGQKVNKDLTFKGTLML